MLLLLNAWFVGLILMQTRAETSFENVVTIFTAFLYFFNNVTSSFITIIIIILHKCTSERGIYLRLYQ